MRQETEIIINKDRPTITVQTRVDNFCFEVELDLVEKVQVIPFINKMWIKMLNEKLGG